MCTILYVPITPESHCCRMLVCPFKTVTSTDLGSKSPGFSQGPLLALKLDSSTSNVKMIAFSHSYFAIPMGIFPRLPSSLKFELLTLTGRVR